MYREIPGTLSLLQSASHPPALCYSLCGIPPALCYSLRGIPPRSAAVWGTNGVFVAPKTVSWRFLLFTFDLSLMFSLNWKMENGKECDQRGKSEQVRSGEESRSFGERGQKVCGVRKDTWHKSFHFPFSNLDALLARKFHYASSNLRKPYY